MAAILCSYGIMINGHKALLHLAIGEKESTTLWKVFLVDVKDQELRYPLLTVIDGNECCRSSGGDKLPVSLVQCC